MLDQKVTSKFPTLGHGTPALESRLGTGGWFLGQRGGFYVVAEQRCGAPRCPQVGDKRKSLAHARNDVIGPSQTCATRFFAAIKPACSRPPGSSFLQFTRVDELFASSASDLHANGDLEKRAVRPGQCGCQSLRHPTVPDDARISP